MAAKSEMTPAMRKALRLMAAKTAADHQGPHDMKQAAMLAEYLRDNMLAEGADGDAVVNRIIHMLNNPTDFAEEFAEVQSREAPPIIDGDGASQPMPAMDEAPPEATMPMPGMQPPPGSTTAKTADNVAKRCPHCDSNTTSVVDDEGKCRCHACKKLFDTEVVKDNVDSFRTAAPELNDHEDLHVRDEDSPSSMRWVDVEGRPIEVGKEYQMNSNRSDIPDFIKVLGPGVINPDTGQMDGPVIGDTLKYEISGEYGLNHIGDLSLEEFDDEEISFERTDEGFDFDDPVSDPDGGEGNSDRTFYEGSPEQTDLSKPTVNMASVWGRHARTDEFARPANYERPNIDPEDTSYPLVDAPYPNKFSSQEAFDAATKEWKRTYLAPALNQRAAKSLTGFIKSKIAKGEEVSPDIWERIEALGGPRYAADDVEGPFEDKTVADANSNWTTWRPPTPEDEEIIRGADNVPVGRGLIMQREGGEPVLHTWPVSISKRIEGEPELFHGEHMKEIGWSDTDGRTAAFDIVTSGNGFRLESNPVWPIESGDMEIITMAHPELDEDSGKPVFSKAAGAEFNLMEQKEFIGEQGVARNADKLDLENTHYADTAMEEHFLFGL